MPQASIACPCKLSNLRFDGEAPRLSASLTDPFLRSERYTRKSYKTITAHKRPEAQVKVRGLGFEGSAGWRNTLLLLLPLLLHFV